MLAQQRLQTKLLESSSKDSIEKVITFQSLKSQLNGILGDNDIIMIWPVYKQIQYHD
jgi:hypothetical protein